jgi:hypothetical protein
MGTASGRATYVPPSSNRRDGPGVGPNVLRTVDFGPFSDSADPSTMESDHDIEVKAT